VIGEHFKSGYLVAGLSLGTVDLKHVHRRDWPSKFIGGAQVLDSSIEGFQECGYRVAWSLTASEQRKVSELRAEVFCRELGWTGTREDSVECDEFDDASTHIAVFDENSELIGAVRMINAVAPWMLDNVFANLGPSTPIDKAFDTAEASRLAVNRRWRGKRLGNGMRACDLIYKAAYVYCKLNSIRYLYLVTSDIVLAHMQRSGLPCRALSTPRLMPDGVRALTVVIDWDRIRETPALAAWFESTPAPAAAQSTARAAQPTGFAAHAAVLAAQAAACAAQSTAFAGA